MLIIHLVGKYILHMDPSWVFRTKCPIFQDPRLSKPYVFSKKRPGCAVPIGRGGCHDPLVHVTWPPGWGVRYGFFGDFKGVLLATDLGTKQLKAVRFFWWELPVFEIAASI